tara:strand:- start:1221 stop:1844 length:624 start_codon:yes stop_codon:yes gene_type:complete
MPKTRISVVIDTETSGLPSKRFACPQTEVSAYDTCRVVQIGWVILKGDQPVLKKCYFVRPEGFEISKEASKVNGITTERATYEGISFDIVFNEFIADLNSSGVTHLVAHNLEFDKNAIVSEFSRRAGHSANKETFIKLKEVCTMQCGRDYAKIPLPSNPAKYKAPKLTELYATLFGKNMREKHDALYDAEKCCECYLKMREMRKMVR